MVCPALQLGHDSWPLSDEGNFTMEKSHWAARGTNMVRCLAAPLSPREISQLLDLRHGKSQSDPAGFKRFIMLGLVEERPGGFAITELSRQRLDA